MALIPLGFFSSTVAHLSFLVLCPFYLFSCWDMPQIHPLIRWLTTFLNFLHTFHLNILFESETQPYLFLHTVYLFLWSLSSVWSFGAVIDHFPLSLSHQILHLPPCSLSVTGEKHLPWLPLPLSHLPISLPSCTRPSPSSFMLGAH